MMSVYSRSLPLLSFHFLYITEASTLAGEKVFGSLRREMTLRRMVLGAGAQSQQVQGVRGVHWLHSIHILEARSNVVAGATG